MAIEAASWSVIVALLSGTPDREGASEVEVRLTLEEGERFSAKHGHTGFRRNFSFGKEWNSKHYSVKQIEAYAVDENGWLVITVIVKFF